MGFVGVKGLKELGVDVDFDGLLLFVFSIFIFV
jgi:hypothetical protein